MKRQVYKLKDTAQTDYTTLDPQNLHLFVDESEESGGGDFIPLTGTKVNSPVTGTINTESINAMSSIQSDLAIGVADNYDLDDTSRSGGIALTSDVIKSTSSLYAKSTSKDGVILTIESPETGTQSAKLIVDLTEDPDFKGFEGSDYYGANYDDNTYVQKKYVDDNFEPIGGGGVVPDASPTVKGISKLYNDLLASNTDGSVTQAAIVDGLASLMTSIDNSLTKDIIEKGLIWQVPNINGSYSGVAASQYLRLATAPITQNIVTTQEFGMSVGVIETTAVAGTSGGIRRNDSLNLQPYSNIISVRDFTVNNTISNDCRIIVGFSKNYTYAFPSNAEPTTFTECILVAKLSTSNNLHIVHNDNTGTATSIDLGVNFPANNNLYKYRMILIKESASSYYVQVIKTTLSSGVLLASSTYHLTSDLPTAGGLLQQIMWINNNASAVNMKLGDYGLIIKKV